jgi:hypothetical protein
VTLLRVDREVSRVESGSSIFPAKQSTVGWALAAGAQVASFHEWSKIKAKKLEVEMAALSLDKRELVVLL